MLMFIKCYGHGLNIYANHCNMQLNLRQRLGVGCTCCLAEKKNLGEGEREREMRTRIVDNLLPRYLCRLWSVNGVAFLKLTV